MCNVHNTWTLLISGQRKPAGVTFFDQTDVDIKPKEQHKSRLKVVQMFFKK
jgi:hypothetical protein